MDCASILNGKSVGKITTEIIIVSIVYLGTSGRKLHRLYQDCRGLSLTNNGRTQSKLHVDTNCWRHCSRGKPGDACRYVVFTRGMMQKSLD